MALDKHVILVNRLLEKTIRGEIDWRSSINDDTFQVSFGDNTLRIREARRKVTGAEVTDYYLDLINAEGLIVESISDVEIDEDQDPDGNNSEKIYFKKMKEIHQLARRTVLGSEKILNSILTKLE